jgi:hypothetical protein
VKYFAASLLTIALGGCTGGNWEYAETKSEMTDDVTYSIKGRATEEREFKNGTFHPWLKFNVLPDRGWEFEFCAQEPIRGDRYDKPTLLVRLDDEPPLTLSARAVKGRDGVYGVYVPDDFPRRLSNAKTLLVEYTASFSGKKLAHIPLAGFKSQLDKLCARFTKECRFTSL